MTREEIEGTIRNANAMTEIATGIKTDKESNEIIRDSLEGKISRKEAHRKIIEHITGKHEGTRP